MRSRLHSRGAMLAGFAVAGLALAGGAAYAVIPDANGVVHTCVNKSSGKWRTIDSPTERCKQHETVLDLYSKAGADAAFLNGGDVAGGDLTGTYPNPTIAPNKVDGGKVADDSLTGADIVESSLGQVPSAADSNRLGGQLPSHFMQNGDSAGGDLTGTYPNPSVKQGPGSGLDADTVDGLDSSAFVPSGRVRTTGFVSLVPGETRTLLSANQVELIAVCSAGPTTELQLASNAGGGGFGIYSADTTSKGNVSGGVSDGSPVTIASVVGIDGGRFNIVGFFGAAMSGTFVSYSGAPANCNFEATAITDNGPSGSSLARSARETIAEPHAG